MADPKNLSPEVVALLKKGDKIGAMKLMLQGAAKSGQVSVRMSGTSLPPDVVALLKSGHKIEAIKLLRERTGLGLAEAKGHVETHEASHGQSPAYDDTSDHMPRPSVGAATAKPSTYVKREGLSPGEVPRTNSVLHMAIFVAAIAAAVAAYFAMG